MRGCDSLNICSKREKNNECTSAKWHACSWADHLSGRGRRFTTSGGTSRTRGMIILGALASDVITDSVSCIFLAYLILYLCIQPCRNDLRRSGPGSSGPTDRRRQRIGNIANGEDKRHAGFLSTVNRDVIVLVMLQLIAE